MPADATTIKVALDWTPNTIHSGLYLALARGLYEDAGLDVRLLPPDPPYSKTPAKQLQAGEVDLAICPSESVIAYAESEKPVMKLEAVFAILQKDASAIVSISDRFQRPRDLERGHYGSYNARYEDRIVQAMVETDGGDSSLVHFDSNKGKLSMFKELQQGNIDATWIFLPWEGVEAQMEGVALNIFKTEDFEIPYGYSPVIAQNANSALPKDALIRFIQATRRGYEMAQQDSDAAVAALQSHCDPARSSAFLGQSQREINGFYSDGSQVGTMKLERWQTWIRWLKHKDLVAMTDLKAEDLFTNEYHGRS